MTLVLTCDRYFLVKIGVICKNGGVGIGLASWGRVMLLLLSVECGELWGAPRLWLR